jgi:hypothetical protein
VSKQLPVKRGRQEGQLSSYHLQFTSHFYCLAGTKVALARSAALSPPGKITWARSKHAAAVNKL